MYVRDFERIFDMVDINILMQKLDTEIASVVANKTAEDKAALIMKNAVKEKIIMFCTQSDDFATAVLSADKNFGECMKAVSQNPGNGISDIEAYKRAVKYYFPDADIEFSMKIKTASKSNIISVNFSDLLD